MPLFFFSLTDPPDPCFARASPPFRVAHLLFPVNGARSANTGKGFESAVRHLRKAQLIYIVAPPAAMRSPVQNKIPQMHKTSAGRKNFSAVPPVIQDSFMPFLTMPISKRRNSCTLSVFFGRHFRRTETALMLRKCCLMPLPAAGPYSRGPALS